MLLGTEKKIHPGKLHLTQLVNRLSEMKRNKRTKP